MISDVCFVAGNSIICPAAVGREETFDLLLESRHRAAQRRELSTFLQANCYGAQRTGCTAGTNCRAASAGVQRSLIEALAGGPGSSSAPGSRVQQTHPLAGVERTRLQPGREHSAAVPWAVKPSNDVQCQQGRGLQARSAGTCRR
jgi:hypothetical protein